MSEEDETLDTENEESDYENETSSYVLREKHCVMCQKVFCRLSYVNYAYKIPCSTGHKFFCSWSCMQKYRRLQEEKRDKSKDEKKMGVATDKEAQKKPPKYSREYQKKRR